MQLNPTRNAIPHPVTPSPKVWTRYIKQLYLEQTAVPDKLIQLASRTVTQQIITMYSNQG